MGKKCNTSQLLPERGDCVHAVKIKKKNISEWWLWRNDMMLKEIDKSECLDDALSIVTT